MESYPWHLRRNYTKLVGPSAKSITGTPSTMRHFALIVKYNGALMLPVVYHELVVYHCKEKAKKKVCISPEHIAKYTESALQTLCENGLTPENSDVDAV